VAQSQRSPVVRDAKPADAAGIAAIGREALPRTFRGIVDPAVLRSIVAQSYSVEALEACIARCRRTPDAHFLVAELDRRVVGFLHYDTAGEGPELHRIYIDSSLLRKGIGSALLAELHARLAHGTSYILMVIAANVPAVTFYRRHGFVVDAHVDGPTYMSDHMGVTYPRGTQPAPALVMRFTKPSGSEGAGVPNLATRRLS
jgi:ribosomal protein S18 acetylase RimI-like enzyme